MKTRSFILVAAAMLFIAGCAPKVSDTTSITGILGGDAANSLVNRRNIFD